MYNKSNRNCTVVLQLEGYLITKCLDTTAMAFFGVFGLTEKDRRSSNEDFMGLSRSRLGRSKRIHRPGMTEHLF